jgi:hypothetical protein
MAQKLNHYRRTVTYLFSNGAAGADLIQSKGLPFAGDILHIRQVNGLNTGARTAQLEVVDNLGVVIHDGTALAHNASHDHEFVATRRCLAGNDTLRMTISGDPGVSGYKIDVVFSLFGRDG